jgi:CheY-like chemotaxis protein
MPNNLDSTGLFVEQMGGHVADLSELLMGGTLDAIDVDTIDRAILSTKMLASSASLMGLTDWQVILGMYANVLEIYQDKGLFWDERIAQSTSEIIEKEETFVSSLEEPASSTANHNTAEEALQESFHNVISSDESQAFSTELTELRNYAQSAPPPRRTNGALPQSANPPRPAATSVEASRTQPASPPTPHGAAGDVDEQIARIKGDISRPLGRSLGELRRHVLSLLTQWNEASWDLNAESTSVRAKLRGELFLINFYALAIERNMAIAAHDRTTLTVGSMLPVRSALEDFAGVLTSGTGRRMDIDFAGEQHAIDARLLFAAQKVLQCMISDIFERCDEEYLRVQITIQETHGSLMWSIKDNGDISLSDSRLDREEHLAFYPSLMEICRTLGEFSSLLWVEPANDEEARFAFTLPVTPDGGPFVVWGKDKRSFAVLSSQVSDIVPLGHADLHNDERGEFIRLDGNRIPLLNLAQVYSGAPDGGDRVVVIGCLEKRVAFYAKGEGQLRFGAWLKNSIPAWKGMERGVAQIDGTRFPLVEANGLLGRYVRIINTSVGEGPGGGIGDDNGPSQTQARIEKEVMPPPDTSKDEKANRVVLVLDRSESIRKSLATIFARKSFKAKIVHELDAAIDFIEKESPSLIISEFRVPSMAAKILAEKVRAGNRDIPILVTTKHKGNDADVLVSKLGIAGYISKPLNAEDVLNCVGGILGAPVTSKSSS